MSVNPVREVGAPGRTESSMTTPVIDKAATAAAAVAHL